MGNTCERVLFAIKCSKILWAIAVSNYDLQMLIQELLNY